MEKKNTGGSGGSQYDKVKTLGEGAYGKAVLVRTRGDDQHLQVIKTIDINALSEDD